jgi:Zn-dependent protease with chaperone function
MATEHPATPSQPKAYAKAKLRLSLLSGAMDLAILTLLLATGASVALARWSESVWRPWPLETLLYLLVLGAGLTLLGLPWDWAKRKVEIQFGLNRQSVASWWADQAKGAALGAVLLGAAVELVYWLLHASPERWWMWAWAGFAVFMVIMAQLGPVLLLPIFFKLRPMSAENEGDRAVVERLLAAYARQKAQNPKLPRLHGIYEWKLGEKSAKANAALTGLGQTRRVIISDTLLEASTPEEIEAVFLHELGHHVHADIWQGLAFQSGLSLLGFWLAQAALTALGPKLGLSGIADIGGLPLLALVFSLLSLVLLPASNGFTRRMERRADDYSFAALGTAGPLIAGLEKLAQKNLAEREPARWKEFLLYSHPSIATRVRRGREWERRQGSAVGIG